jgi:HAD superfamily hydrolase (TIGR01484 family)
VRFVLCDIDDTLTDGGQLTARAYDALERLHAAGLRVVPVTGRPAGWCDLIARFWPVDAVVGENGALWFAYDREARRMSRRYWKTEQQRREDRQQLALLEARILAEVPGAAVAADQAYREADLAIDFREDVAPLAKDAVARIVAIFEAAGAQAKASSIHVNGWFGDYDKLAMSRCLLQERFGVHPDTAREQVLFVGDSPNDAPMFAHFTYTVGVANVCDFAGHLAAEPAWVTEARGGGGFAELAAALLEAR